MILRCTHMTIWTTLSLRLQDAVSTGCGRFLNKRPFRNWLKEESCLDAPDPLTSRRTLYVSFKSFSCATLVWTHSALNMLNIFIVILVLCPGQLHHVITSVLPLLRMPRLDFFFSSSSSAGGLLCGLCSESRFGGMGNTCMGFGSVL